MIFRLISRNFRNGCHGTYREKYCLMSNSMTQSTLFVPVPEAEPWVKDLRERYDPIAAAGVPAHITVLFPFISPDLLTASDLVRTAEIFQCFQSFGFRLEQVDRFPESLYLVPEPDEPLISLTEAIVREFPEYPPYGGKFTEDCSTPDGCE